MARVGFGCYISHQKARGISARTEEEHMAEGEPAHVSIEEVEPEDKDAEDDEICRPMDRGR